MSGINLTISWFWLFLKVSYYYYCLFAILLIIFIFYDQFLSYLASKIENGHEFFKVHKSLELVIFFSELYYVLDKLIFSMRVVVPIYGQTNNKAMDRTNLYTAFDKIRVAYKNRIK
jgi:hypothetical protein